MVLSIRFDSDVMSHIECEDMRIDTVLHSRLWVLETAADVPRRRNPLPMNPEIYDTNLRGSILIRHTAAVHSMMCNMC